MLITRKIGKLVRGKATPFQIIAACVLGAMIGFVPGFTEAPGLLVALILLLVILNANLFLAGAVALLALAMNVLLMPVSYGVGRILLDGPTQPLFKWLINAPVFALFGFEYYATTGGQVIAIILGAALGIALVALLQRFRRRMMNLEEQSEKYRNFTSRKWVKAATWTFLGSGRGKKTYEEIMSKKVGNPIRTIGAIAAAIIVIFLVIAYQFLSEPIVTYAMKSGLERANGATVNLDAAELNLREMRVELRGLAMADPNDLDTDLLRAERINGDISGANLLRKRMALDNVEMINASTGERRDRPGRIIRRPDPVDPDDDPIEPQPDERTIEDYIEQAEQWRERLAQIRDWLDVLSGPQDDAEDTQDGPGRERLEDRLRRRIRELGYAGVRADHLIDDAPTFIVYRLAAEGVRSRQLEDETIDIHGRNLSTHPHLNEEPTEIRIESSGETLLAAARLVPRHLGEDSTLAMRFLGLPTDRLVGQLVDGDSAPMRGGTIDVDAQGTWNPADATIDFPMLVTLRNTQFSAGGTSRDIEQLDLPLGVRGRIDNPKILLDDELLAAALMQAGADELARQLSGLSDEAMDRLRGELDEVLQDGLGDIIGDGIGDRLPGFGGGDREDDEEGDKSNENVGDRIRRGLGGLLDRDGDGDDE